MGEDSIRAVIGADLARGCDIGVHRYVYLLRSQLFLARSPTCGNQRERQWLIRRDLRA